MRFKKLDIRYFGGIATLIGMIIFVTGRIEAGLIVGGIGLVLVIQGMLSNRKRLEDERKAEQEKRRRERDDPLA